MAAEVAVSVHARGYRSFESGWDEAVLRTRGVSALAEMVGDRESFLADCHAHVDAVRAGRRGDDAIVQRGVVADGGLRFVERRQMALAPAENPGGFKYGEDGEDNGRLVPEFSLLGKSDFGLAAYSNLAFSLEVPVSWPGMTIAVDLSAHCYKHEDTTKLIASGAITAKYSFGAFSISGFVKGTFLAVSRDGQSPIDMIQTLARYVVRRNLPLDQEQRRFMGALRTEIDRATSEIEKQWTAQKLGLAAQSKAIKEQLDHYSTLMKRGSWRDAYESLEKRVNTSYGFPDPVSKNIIGMGLTVLAPYRAAIHKVMKDFGVSLNVPTIRVFGKKDRPAGELRQRGESLSVEEMAKNKVYQGYFEIHVDSATFTKNDKWDTPDAYVKFETPTDAVRTRTIKNNKSPVWDEKLRVWVSDVKRTHLRVSVHDEDVARDDMLSKGVLDMNIVKLLLNPGKEMHKAYFVFKSHGQLRFSVKWVRMDPTEVVGNMGKRTSQGDHVYKYTFKDGPLRDKNRHFDLQWKQIGGGKRARRVWHWRSTGMFSSWQPVTAQSSARDIKMPGEQKAVLAFIAAWPPIPPMFVSGDIQLSLHRAIMLHESSAVNLVKDYLLADTLRHWRSAMRRIREIYALAHMEVGMSEVSLATHRRDALADMVKVSSELNKFTRLGKFSPGARKMFAVGREALGQMLVALRKEVDHLHREAPSMVKRPDAFKQKVDKAPKVFFDAVIEVGLGFSVDTADLKTSDKVPDAKISIAVLGGIGLRGNVNSLSYDEPHTWVRSYKALKFVSSLVVNDVTIGPTFVVKWVDDGSIYVIPMLDISMPAEKLLPFVPKTLRLALSKGGSALKSKGAAIANSALFKGVGAALKGLFRKGGSLGRSVFSGGSGHVKRLSAGVTNAVKSLKPKLATLLKPMPTDPVDKTTVGLTSETRAGGSFMSVMLFKPDGSAELLPKFTFARPFVGHVLGVKAAMPKWLGKTLANVKLSASFEVGAMVFWRNQFAIVIRTEEHGSGSSTISITHKSEASSTDDHHAFNHAEVQQ
eukprot:TRINITY_DN66494_c1_g1_i1.p1 TRINITY_DN66494_c1_g1~~TRINITY_DN66494_c1_g1_i1.p1  ORF type:complete len:1069 (-),score=571.85 TRINITY_DN66494_c1_g1_i1:91-3189(-)